MYVYVCIYYIAGCECDDDDDEGISLRNSMVQRLERSAYDCGKATFVKVSHRMGDQNLLSRASEGTLSCWSRLYLQSLAPTPVSRRVAVRQAASHKYNSRISTTT
jgi:hypothetical protein